MGWWLALLLVACGPQEGDGPQVGVAEPMAQEEQVAAAEASKTKGSYVFFAVAGPQQLVPLVCYHRASKSRRLGEDCADVAQVGTVVAELQGQPVTVEGTVTVDCGSQKYQGLALSQPLDTQEFLPWAESGNPWCDLEIRPDGALPEPVRMEVGKAARELGLSPEMKDVTVEVGVFTRHDFDGDGQDEVLAYAGFPQQPGQTRAHTEIFLLRDGAPPVRLDFGLPGMSIAHAADTDADGVCELILGSDSDALRGAGVARYTGDAFELVTSWTCPR